MSRISCIFFKDMEQKRFFMKYFTIRKLREHVGRRFNDVIIVMKTMFRLHHHKSRVKDQTIVEAR